jgi:hypothetical protein
MWITQIMNNGDVNHYYMGYGINPEEKFRKRFGVNTQEKELIISNRDPR